MLLSAIVPYGEFSDQGIACDFLDVIGEIAAQDPAEESGIVFGNIPERSSGIFAEIDNNFVTAPLETSALIDTVRTDHVAEIGKTCHIIGQFGVAFHFAQQDFKGGCGVGTGTVSIFQILAAEEFVGCGQGSGIKFAENIVGINDLVIGTLERVSGTLEFLFEDRHIETGDIVSCQIAVRKVVEQLFGNIRKRGGISHIFVGDAVNGCCARRDRDPRIQAADCFLLSAVRKNLDDCNFHDTVTLRRNSGAFNIKYGKRTLKFQSSGHFSVPVLCLFIVFFFEAFKIIADVVDDSRKLLFIFRSRIYEGLVCFKHSACGIQCTGFSGRYTGNIGTFKNFALFEEKKFESGNKKFLKIKTRVYHIMAGFHSSTRMFDGVMYIVVVVAGGLFMLDKHISPADYVAYLMFVTTLLTSIRRIVEFSEQFQRGLTGLERFCEIMDTEPEIVDSADAKDIETVRGEIEFRDVSFAYESGDKKVLSHLDLKVSEGESIALVGPSGGGKTTLCSLIPRFYEVSSGEILIDGVDIKDITTVSLRNHIGIVAQDVYMFSGSIRENIAYGRLDATDEEIIEAAKLAGAHDFITELSDGYDTYVGERGFKLSGGQKQRISIARVFLKNPPVLILDEATSALDNESERLVQRSLERLAKGRTTFTIAHRLTTVKNADRILVLTENGIAESGSHDELLGKGGIYSELYAMYSEK